MQESISNRKFSYTTLFSFLMLCVAFFTWTYSYLVQTFDFKGHMYFTSLIQAEGLGAVPHFLYHVLILGIAEIFPSASWYTIAGFIMSGANVITGLTIYLLLTKWFKDYVSQPFIAFLSFSLMVITPIIIWTEHWPAMIGYIHPTVYHNPTQIILKLFVIPVSLIALRSFNPKPYKNQLERIGLIVLSIVLIVLMSLSKPNYTIILLPSLGLYCLYRLFNKQQLDWPLLILGIGLPSVTVLGLQFLGTYTSDDSVIAIGFMRVVRLYITYPRIILQYLLSIAFPLAVYLLHYKTAKQDTYLNFAWSGFLIGSFYYYFVYETGIREEHLNFAWSSYTGLFILMFATIIFLLKEHRPFIEAFSQDKKTPIPSQLKWILPIFILHMASAFRYYLFFVFLIITELR